MATTGERMPEPDQNQPCARVGAAHLPRQQLGLRRPGALDLVPHAVEQGDAILVLVETKELRQDLSSFL